MRNLSRKVEQIYTTQEVEQIFVTTNYTISYALITSNFLEEKCDD